MPISTEVVEISETGVRDLLSLADYDPLQAERLINSVTFRERLSLILQATGHGRERLVLMAHDAKRLVTSLPEEEFYYTLKEIGVEDATDLLSLASPQHITFCLDIEAWKNDRINPRKLLDWLELILECGDSKTWELVRDADEDLLITLLAGQSRIVKPGTEIEPLEIDEQWFTLDNQYYLRFKGMGRSYRILTHLLELIFRRDHEFYVRLLEGALWSVPGEIEEHALRWRQSRLLDKGFPELYESMEIYRYLDPSSVTTDHGTKDTSGRIGSDRWVGITPNFYLVPQRSGDFFSQALYLALEREGMEEIKGELAYLCNKAMVADGIDVSQLDKVKETLGSVYHYINLGLSFVSRGDLEDAIRALRTLYLAQLFRTGYSLTMELRRRAEKILTDSWFPEGRKNLTLLDSPHHEMMEALLCKKPMFFEGLVDPTRATSRGFEHLSEVHLTEKRLGEVESLLQLHGHVYGFDPEMVLHTDLRGCHPYQWQDVTFTTITLVCIANYTLTGKMEFSPLRPRDVQRILERILRDDGQGRVLPEIRQDFLVKIRGYLMTLMGARPEDEKEQAWRFWGRCLERFADEFGYLRLERPLDPRFIKGLVIRGG